jgi:hypothetical protein
MKAMLTAFAAIAVIAVAANMVLEEQGYNAANTTASPNVRLD